MANKKQRLHTTQTDNLVSNLRGEVGEIITTWLLWDWIRQQEIGKQSDDMQKDLENKDLHVLSILSNKLKEEMVARLSELGEEKIGQINFYFASKKLNAFEKETKDFTEYVVKHKFREKRNLEISHKNLPPTFNDWRLIVVPNVVVLRAVTRAAYMMKKIDRLYLGPEAPYLWKEMRKKRYDFIYPPKVMYLLLPHLHLSAETRVRIINEEIAEGKPAWEKVQTRINGKEATILANRKWGAIIIGDRIQVLEQYPLQQVESIDF